MCRIYVQFSIHTLLRVKLTVNLPTLEPFPLLHEEWNYDATPPSFRRKPTKSIREAQMVAEVLFEECPQKETALEEVPNDILCEQQGMVGALFRSCGLI